MEATLNAGDDVQVRVDLATDGSGHSLSSEIEPRRAIVHTAKRNAYLKSGHILMVPLTDEEESNWADVQKYEFDGETCVKLTNVKARYLA